MKHTDPSSKQRKVRPFAVVRAAIQLAAFLLVPGLFITLFAALKGIYTSVIGGTFTLSGQLVNILLTAAVLLITLLWGRVICGFACSFGAMQDLLWLGGRHLPLKLWIPPKADRVLKYLKYAVLLFIVTGVWTFGIFGDTVWSPWTVFGAAAAPWNDFAPQAVILSVGGALLLFILLGSLFIERFFCKYLCPLGALFALTSRFRVFKIKRKAESCSGRCRICTEKCSMSIPLYRHEKVNSGECINCLKCTAACPRGNIKADALPALSGTMAAAALTGVCFVGTLPLSSDSASPAVFSEQPALNTITDTGRYRDGIYSGSAAGFRGTTAVAVTVENGDISDITVISSGDDREFLSRAQEQIIPAIIDAQDPDVAVVSGATFSSRGIINAVTDALGDQLTEAETPTEAVIEAVTESPTEAPSPTNAPEEEQDEPAYTEQQQDNGSFTDGTYYGSGSGYRGTTSVEVTVQNGRITDITVTSYQDDYQFFSRAESGVIASILSSQSVDVSTVSGATFSSNSIIEAVADALGQTFTNPNSEMGGGHGHRR